MVQRVYHQILQKHDDSIHHARIQLSLTSECGHHVAEIFGGCNFLGGNWGTSGKSLKASICDHLNQNFPDLFPHGFFAEIFCGIWATDIVQNGINDEFCFASRSCTKDFQHLSVPEIIFVELQQGSGVITACHSSSPRSDRAVCIQPHWHGCHQ